MAKQANITPPKFGEDVPARREAPTPTGPGIFRVSLEGLRVRVNFDETMPGGPQYRDYLEVSATDEIDAVEKFAKYNGIPMRTDPLTGEKRMASIHAPSVVRVTGTADPPPEGRRTEQKPEPEKAEPEAPKKRNW